MKLIKVIAIFLFLQSFGWAQYILVPMDLSQTNHIKAYGVAYWVLKHDVKVEWLLNYRGGSFLFTNTDTFKRELQLRGVTFEEADGNQVNQIYAEIESQNMEKVLLEKAPKIAIYSPPGFLPWDDAVTMVMAYSEIEYDVIYDTEVLAGKLSDYDWLHLHHEDFTGQYGKFWGRFRNENWYIKQQIESEELAQKLDRSKNYIINQAIKEFVTRQFMEDARWSDTLNALESVKLDKTVDENEVTTWLESWRCVC